MGEGYNSFDLSVEAITWWGSKWRLLWFTSLVKIRQVLNKDKDGIQSLTMFCKKVPTRVGCCASVTRMTRSTQWTALWTNKQLFLQSPQNAAHGLGARRTAFISLSGELIAEKDHVQHVGDDLFGN